MHQKRQFLKLHNYSTNKVAQIKEQLCKFYPSSTESAQQVSTNTDFLKGLFINDIKPIASSNFLEYSIPPSSSVLCPLSQKSRLGCHLTVVNNFYDKPNEMCVVPIPHICHRLHRRCQCKTFLSDVNFSRSSEKKLHTFDFFRNIFSVFGVFSCFFGCEIWFSKILPV